MSKRSELSNFCFSVYLHEDEMCSLINRLFIDLLQELEKVFELKYFLIHLSSHRGNNVGVTLILPSTNRVSAAYLVRKRIQNYMFCQPKKTEIKSNATGIFKDFPMSTIQYNLHNFPFELYKADNQVNTVEISNLLTEIILNLEDFSYSTKFSVTVYLHCFLLKFFFAECDETERQVLKNYVFDIIIRRGQILGAISRNNFTEYILEVRADVFLHKYQFDSSFDNWLEYFSSIIKKKLLRDFDEKLMFFMNVSDLIVAQLGVEQTAQSIVLEHII